jgi:hypothetical protein
VLKLDFPRTLEFPPVKREFATNDILTFSNKWPNGLGIAPGHTYQVLWHQEVPYDLHYIISAADYKDVNLSDGSGATPVPGQENLYPYGANMTIYQMLIGFKPGNYMVHLYMPSAQWILGLEYTNMYPSNANMADPKLKYIGSIKPEDSPYYDPRLKLITVYNMLPFYLRFLVDDGDDEKCIAPMIINHCQLTDVTGQITPQQKAKETVIRYISEAAFRLAQSGG